MASSMSKGSCKLPRLKMNEEVIKASPELSKLLMDNPEESDFNAIPYHPTQRKQTAGGNRAGLETPRGLGEDLTEEEELALELREIKRERAVLLQSLVATKAVVGTAGGEAQQSDMRQLEKELELKKAKLNELRQSARDKERYLEKMKTTTQDTLRLIPGEAPDARGSIENLKSEMTRLHDELIEAEAKNRLYFLLGERTRRDHMAMEKKVQEAREMKDDCYEDYATLTQHMHDMRASKEEAEKQLNKMKRMYDDARKDWSRKLRDRKGEVAELRKRQEKDREREEKRQARLAEKERAEKELQAKIKMEREAYEMQIDMLAPKIEAMEASWNRLRTISGAETPDDVIAYWEGLKAKEENMRELVKTAEAQEQRAKEEINALLEKRSEMFEASSAAQREVSTLQEEHHNRIEDASRRMEVTKKKFSRLREVCIASEQGLRSMLERLSLALQGTGDDTGHVNTTLADLHPPPAGDAASEGMSGGEPAEFFPQLPLLLVAVTERLTKLQEIEQQLLVERPGVLEAAKAGIKPQAAAAAAPPPAPAAELQEMPESAAEEDGAPAADPGAAEEGGEEAGGAAALAADAGALSGEEGELKAAAEAPEDGAAADGAEKEGEEGAADEGGAEAAEDTEGGEDAEVGGGEAAEAAAGAEGGEEAAADTEAAGAEAEEGAAAAEGEETEAGETAGTTEDGPALEAADAAVSADAPAEEAASAAAAKPAAAAAAVAAEDASSKPADHSGVSSSSNTVGAPPSDPAPEAASAVPAVVAAAIPEVEEEEEEVLPATDASLLKGMKKSSWSGPAWLDTIANETAVPLDMIANTRRVKGKKKSTVSAPDLKRIHGFTGDETVDDKEDDDEEDGDDWGGVVDRDFIKHRASKVLKQEALRGAAERAA